MDELIHILLRCDVLKTGNFKLKDGRHTPIYVDLRRIIHFPDVVKRLAFAVRSKQTEDGVTADTVCGVPYTALPVASVFSVLYRIPMVMKRKEAKDYGTHRLVEGVWNVGDSCLIVDDVVASGTSLVETAMALRKEGLTVEHCVVVVDKIQGGSKNLGKFGLTLHSLFDIDAMFDAYCSMNKVEPEVVQLVTSYFKDNSYLPVHKDRGIPVLSHAERAKRCNHPVAKRLLEIMEVKKSNLCVAVDADDSRELLEIAKQVGHHVCLLKTHVDILKDFSQDFVVELKKISKEYNFLLLEDRKFSEIGKTVTQQYANGMYNIQTWADLVTVSGNRETIEALKQMSDKNACVLAADINYDSYDYTEKAFEIAENNLDFVIGFIGRRRNPKSENLIWLSSEISTASSSDLEANDQLIENAVADGADIVIISEGISRSSDVAATAAKYKSRGFNAYINRVT